MPMMELAESLKSDALAGDVTQLRGKVEQLKSMVEAMAGKESMEYAVITIMTSVFEATENPETAIEQVKQALAKIEGDPVAPPSVKAMGYSTLGSLYWRLNQPRLAVAAGTKALEFSEQLPEIEAQSAQRNILLYLVAAESSRGDLDAAERYFRRLEQLPADPAGSAGDQSAVLLAMTKAQLLEAQGSMPEAEAAYLDCLKKLGVREDSEFGASISGLLGSFYMQLGDYDRAEEFYRKAAESSKACHGEESSLYAAALENSAWISIKQGKLEEGKRTALRALDLARRTGQGSNKVLISELCYDLAFVHWRLGDLDAAQRYANESMEGGLDKVNPSANGPSLWLLAGILLAKGQFEEALRTNDECSDLVVAQTGPESRWVARALAQRGEIYRCMGQDDKAREVAAKLMPLTDKLFVKILSMDERSRLAWQGEQLSLGFEACVLPDKDVADTVIRRKGAVVDSILEDRARARRFLGNEAAAGKLREIARLRARVAKLAFSTDPEDRKDAELLARKASELERSIAKAGSAAGGSGGIFATDSADIQASLGADETALVFFSFEDPKLPEGKRRCYGVVVLPGGDGPVSVVRLQAADAIDAAVDGYRKALAGGDEAGLDRCLQDIVSRVWLPVAGKIPPDCAKLFVAPDGNLNFLSFAALPTGDDTFVADRFSISYVGSGRDILRREKGAHEKSLSVFANPRFGSSADDGESTKLATRTVEAGIYGAVQLPPLPGTEAEGKMLREAATAVGWRTEVSEGPEASEDRVRKVSSPGILHLATHGFYLNSRADFSPDSRGMSVVATENGLGETASPAAEGVDPMRASGIALSGAQTTFKSWAKGVAPEPQSDGILTAEEIAALDLGGTWLVTLSACETGVGEARAGEGVLGLRRAFMMSGAENLLMTLWPVSDTTTAEIMRDFYREALASDDAPSSLAKVQKEWLGRLRREKGLFAAVREAGPFAMVVMARPSP